MEFNFGLGKGKKFTREDAKSDLKIVAIADVAIALIIISLLATMEESALLWVLSIVLTVILLVSIMLTMTLLAAVYDYDNVLFRSKFRDRNGRIIYEKDLIVVDDRIGIVVRDGDNFYLTPFQRTGNNFVTNLKDSETDKLEVVGSSYRKGTIIDGAA